MAAVIRLARERFWVPVLPAAVSWLFLFGYQWAFYVSYRGHQPTVFSYFSGVIGDGLLIPAVNVAAFVTLRQLAPGIPWRRLPVYVLLGCATATAAFLTQARLDLVNWSMPIAFHWSDVGQFHFFVMSAEISYLYLALATVIDSWPHARRDAVAWRFFVAGWAGVALFAASLAADYIR
ncbi:MAG: hypothetical protein ABI334_05290 [Candidatus Dormiibacterota bacterium]